jgi:hypothetical protein
MTVFTKPQTLDPVMSQINSVLSLTLYLFKILIIPPIYAYVFQVALSVKISDLPAMRAIFPLDLM